MTTPPGDHRVPPGEPQDLFGEPQDLFGEPQNLFGEQQELAGMPAPLYPCTPTRLATWRDCPRRYRFGYLDRPTPPKGAPWAHNSIGAAVHSVLADWWSLPLRARTVDAAERLVRRRWLSDGFRDAGQSARARIRAAGWVTRYLAQLDPAAEPVGVERTVTAARGTMLLSGRVDRIDDRPGRGLVIVDYKTGGHVPDVEDARSSLALAVYAVATTRTLRRPCLQVELHHLPSDTCAVARHTAGELDGAMAGAESTAADCADADAAYRRGDRGDGCFPPSPSPGCSWCDFRRHCPEGQAASPDRTPWSALPD